MAGTPFQQWCESVLRSRRWTLRELARRLGVSASTPYHYRAGNVLPTVAMQRRLADLTGTPVEELGRLVWESKRGDHTDAPVSPTSEPRPKPFTYAAHPVACAAALANIRIMEKDNLVENAEAMGARLLAGLESAVKGRPLVGEVRGRGLLVCVELVEPDGSGRPLDPARVEQLDRLAWERGAIVYARGSVVRLAPPLCITRQEVDQLVDIVAASIARLEADATR